MSRAAPATPAEDAALRERIRAAGLTNRALARAAGVDESGLSKFMHSDRKTRLLDPLRSRVVAVLDRLPPAVMSSEPSTNPGVSMDLFEELFAEVRADMIRREGEVDTLAARTTKAVEAWRAAKRAALKYELASRMGLKREVPTGASDAALAILAACEQIPECAQSMAALTFSAEDLLGAAIRMVCKEADALPAGQSQRGAALMEAVGHLQQAETKYRLTPVAAVAPLPPVRSLTEAARVLNEPPVAVPTLAAQSLPVAIVGGMPSQEKLRWMRESVPRVEWLEMPQGASGQSVLDRISSKRFSSVLMLTGMLHSGHAERVRTAAGAAKVPCVSATTAGHGQLRTAFEELDAKLRGAA